MSKVGSWSQTAGNNNSAPPDGWPEGQAPSTVNDCARELMAQVRTMIENPDFIDYNITPSFLTSTTFSLGTMDAKFEAGRRIKLFDATTLYGTITSVSGTFVQVRLDTGALTSSLSSCALGVLRNSTPGLPDYAYTTKNLIYNGQMTFWQRTASSAAVTNNQFVADRWKYEEQNNSTISIYRLERSANAAYVPTLASAGTYLVSSMNVLVASSAEPALGSNDYAAITYVVEGHDWRTVAHKPLGLSFQVNSNLSGIYSVAMRSSSLSKTYIQNYTITSVNAWQRFFMAFPEAPTDVAWDYSAGAGLWVSWTLACGGNLQVAGNSWTAVNALATSAQVNFLGTVGNSWTLTDVRLKGGCSDTPTVQRTREEERAGIMRYYWKGQPCAGLNGNANANGAVLSWPISFSTPMRTTPTVAAVLAGSTWNALDPATWTFSFPSPYGARFLVFATANSTNNSVTFGANDYFAADAEL